MFAKLVVLILSLGAIACGLLALRQSRLQAASETAQVQLRISKHDEKLWALRSEIASKVAPQQIERMALDVGPLRPMIPGIPGTFGPLHIASKIDNTSPLDSRQTLPDPGTRLKPGGASATKKPQNAKPDKAGAATVASRVDRP